MTKVLVGSQAIRYWWPNFREPNDTDYFSTDPVPGAEVFWHPALAEWYGDANSMATSGELYTIKVSHAFWELRNRSWEKHMADIRYMQMNRPRYPHDDGDSHELPLRFYKPLYDILYPIWEERYGKKRGSLNVEPEEFFNSNVVRVYEHDSIHHSVAYGDRPLFESILKDGAKVMVDTDKFRALDFDTKCRLVREEVYATALERFVIPSDYTYSPRAAYAQALKKTITSFWRGEWALWVVLNYNHVFAPDLNYVELHRSNSDRLIKL